MTPTYKASKHVSRALAAITLALVLTSLPRDASAQAASGVVTMTGYSVRSNCTDSQRTTIRTAAQEALRMLQAPRTPQHLVRWFGSSTDVYLNQQIQHFVAYTNQYALLSLVHFSSAARAGLVWPNQTPIAGNVTFDCGSRSNAYPATVIGDAVVSLNAGFWNLPDRVNNLKVTKASVLIHEMSHLAGTTDYPPENYGYARDNYFGFALDLARFFPQFAVWNANNHEYYYLGL